MSKFQPVGKNILIKQMEFETKSSGGIEIPGGDITGHITPGEVIAVGDEVTVCKVGDLVILPDHAGCAFKNERKYYYLANESFVMCKFKLLDEKDLN